MGGGAAAQVKGARGSDLWRLPRKLGRSLATTLASEVGSDYTCADNRELPIAWKLSDFPTRRVQVSPAQLTAVLHGIIAIKPLPEFTKVHHPGTTYTTYTTYMTRHGKKPWVKTFIPSPLRVKFL